MKKLNINIRQWLKKLVCMHENCRYEEQRTDKTLDGRYVIRQQKVCQKCGKIIWYRIRYEAITERKQR